MWPPPPTLRVPGVQEHEQNMAGQCNSEQSQGHGYQDWKKMKTKSIFSGT
jgi:hypothetical protein